MLSSEDEKKAIEIIRESPWRFRDIPVQTGKICLAAVRRDPSLLRFVREQNDKICAAALKKDGLSLRFVREQTERLCGLAILQNPEALRFVREQTEKLRDLAIDRSGGAALRWVKDPDEKLCLKAVAMSGDNLRYLPFPFQTEEICEAAVRNDPASIRSASFQTPKLCRLAIATATGWPCACHLSKIISACEYQDADTCMKAVLFQPDCVGAVREQTRELKRAAIEKADFHNLPAIFGKIRNPDEEDCMTLLFRFAKEKSGWDDADTFHEKMREAFRFIPHPTEAVAKRAVAIDGMMLAVVPQNAEITHIGVSQNGLAIQFVPDGSRSRELVMQAVAQNGMALEHVGRQDEDIVLAAVSQNGLSLRFANMQTGDICLAAVKDNGNALEYVREQDEGIILAAVSRCGTALRHAAVKSPEICLAAVSRNGMALEHVPQPVQTREICETAVKEHGWAFHYVRRDLVDENLCDLAVRENPRLIGVIPAEFATREICEEAAKSPAGLNRLSERATEPGLDPFPDFVPDILLAAVKRDPGSIRDIHARAHSAELYRAVFLKEGGISPDLADYRKGYPNIRMDILARVIAEAGPAAPKTRTPKP